jgi:hypothetical protein
MGFDSGASSSCSGRRIKPDGRSFEYGSAVGCEFLFARWRVCRLRLDHAIETVPAVTRRFLTTSLQTPHLWRTWLGCILCNSVFTTVHTEVVSPVTVEITAAQNQAPVVNAGPNQTITLPVNQVTLLGSTTDDGLPNGTLAITWSVVSGGTVSFYNPNEASTQASFSSAGTYVLKLTANDSQLQSSATTTVTVNPPVDQPPAVNAGPNQTITLPANVVMLNGSATDGGLPLTTSWTMASGPAPVLFANSTVPVTTAMFTIAGFYTLQLSASNGQTSASATMTVTVNPQANTPPSGSIVLSPSSAGPILTATVQQLQATVTNNTGGAITNQLVSFVVTGPNQTSGTATTNSSGVATFSYTGTKAGVDAVVATATVGVLPLTSNTSMISWVVQSSALPPQP